MRRLCLECTSYMVCFAGQDAETWIKRYMTRHLLERHNIVATAQQALGQEALGNIELQGPIKVWNR